MMKIARVHGHSVISDLINRDSVVIDLGANKGDFSREAHARFGCQTIAVEPNEEFRAALECPAVRLIIAKPVTSDGREVTFTLHGNRESSSIVEHTYSAAESVQVLPSTTLENLCKIGGVERVDWIKMDIEGAELEVLGGLPDHLLDRIGQISVEFHETIGIGTKSQVEAVIVRMEGKGFRFIRGSRHGFDDVLFVSARLSLSPNWIGWYRGWAFYNGVIRWLARGGRTLTRMGTGTL